MNFKTLGIDHEADLRMRRKNAHSIRARRNISNLEAGYRYAVDFCRHGSKLPCKLGRVHTGPQVKALVVPAESSDIESCFHRQPGLVVRPHPIVSKESC